MGRLFVRGTSYALAAGAGVTAAPLTLACWANLSDVTNSQRLMAVRDDSGLSDAFALQAAGAVAGDPVRAVTAAAGVSSAADSTTGYSANVWFHACAVFDITTGTDRAAFINGGSKGTQTTDRTPAGIAETIIADNTLGPNGIIAEAAIWNVNLTDAEVAALARGVSPLRIRPGNLVFYAPLWGTSSPERDYTRNQNHLTLTGSPAADIHAPIAPFALGDIFQPYAAAPAPQTISLAGTVTPAGALVLLTRKVMSGSVTSAGLLAQAPTIVRAGVLTSSGLLARATSHFLTGTLTSSGALTAMFTKTLTGILMFIGGYAESLRRVGMDVFSDLRGMYRQRGRQTRGRR